MWAGGLGLQSLFLLYNFPQKLQITPRLSGCQISNEQPWYFKIGLFLSFLQTSFIILISLKKKNAYFCNLMWKFVITIFLKIIFWLWISLSFEEYIKIETMRASDQNSSMPFLRNELLKIFEDLFTMTLFTKMTHIYD